MRARVNRRRTPIQRRRDAERKAQRDAEAAEAARQRAFLKFHTELTAALTATPHKRYEKRVVTRLLDEIERLHGDLSKLQREIGYEESLRLFWERDHLRIAKKCDALELELSAYRPIDAVEQQRKGA